MEGEKFLGGGEILLYEVRLKVERVVRVCVGGVVYCRLAYVPRSEGESGAAGILQNITVVGVGGGVVAGSLGSFHYLGF